VARFREFVELVDLLLRQEVASFDELADKLGRDPRTIRHSVACFPPLTPWESPGYFNDMVGRFRSVGIDESS
jgi:hypothetical protein